MIDSDFVIAACHSIVQENAFNSHRYYLDFLKAGITIVSTTYLVIMSLISEADMQLKISSFSFLVYSQTDVGISISEKLLK